MRSGHGTRFLDGCHRFGWIIAPLITLLGAFGLLAHYGGVMEQKVQSLHDENAIIRVEMREGFSAVSTRITRNESIIDSLRRGNQ